MEAIHKHHRSNNALFVELRQAIKEGSIIRAERDLQIAEEWFHIDEEAWQTGNIYERSKNKKRR